MDVVEKIGDFRMGVGDSEVRRGEAGDDSFTHRPRQRIGIPSGSFDLASTPEIDTLALRDALPICRVTTNRMRAGYPAHSS